MGCGAMCGSSSSVAEGSKQAQVVFVALFKQISPNQFLYPVKAIAKFTKEMQLNPHRLQLVLTEKLEPKNMASLGVMEKWKIILFGLDCDRSAYVNCLGYPEARPRAKPTAEKQASEQAGSAKQSANEVVAQKMELIQHKAFTQIEKDIQRTFPSIEFEKKAFASVLKRISNHFPSMGYTQGINFIVGYLLIIGYSERDTFWLFIHMAINRRYMMLGLYEDGFPLINVYTCIFRCMLKRINPRLYTHLYEDIAMFQESAWVFKWFMTCFLSSFPIEMCQFVWDIVFNLGGTGLIKFALALLLKLEAPLLEYDDACDISQFFASLKEIENFNRFLTIRDIVKDAYAIRIEHEDLNELREVKTERGGDNFYAQYFLFKFQQQCGEKQASLAGEQTELAKATDQLHQTNPILYRKLSGSHSTEILNDWYAKLTRERIEFKSRSPVSNPLLQMSKTQSIMLMENSQKISQHGELPSHPELPKNSRTSIQKFASISGFQLQEEIGKVETSIEVGRKTPNPVTNTETKMQSLQVSPANKSKNPNINRYSIKKNRKEAIWNEDDDEKEEIEEIKDKMAMEDQFMYLPRDARFKRKNITHEAAKADDILSMYLHPITTGKGKSSIQNNYIPKSIYNTNTSNKLDGQVNMNPQSSSQITSINHSRLARAGNTVLSNMSVSNASNRSSTSSYRTNNHTLKEGSVNSRRCGCAKNKTEQNQLETIQPMNRGTRKKIERVNQPQQIAEYEQSVELGNTRKRMNTYHDWMINSQGPKHTGNLASSHVNPNTELGSEVEIVPGRQMFKKKNRRDKSGAMNVITHNCPHALEKEVSQCQSHQIPTPALAQEDSCESFVIGITSSRRSQLGEVESVK